MDINGIRVIRHRQLDSTNDEAKRMIARADSTDDIPFDTIIVASEQTNGRGRSGHNFISPKADSLYMSFILRPAKTVSGAAAEIPLTILAAVAICEAIETMDSPERVTPLIKWVNDIYVDGRKICGILAEATCSKGGKSIDAIVLGIGVNINVEVSAFPPDIRDTAGSLNMDKIDIEPFMRAIISRIYARMKEASIAGISSAKFRTANEVTGTGRQPRIAPNTEVRTIDEYRRRSLMPGREITVVRANGRTTRAKAKRVEDNGNLSVEYPDGTRESLNAGEVHLVLG